MPVSSAGGINRYTSHAAGLKLIENLVALIAAPAIHNPVQNKRAIVQVNRLHSALTLARGEADEHGSPVSVGARHAGAPHCRGNSGYAATGFPNVAVSARETRPALRLRGCTSCGNKLISINPQGRAAVTHTPC